MFVRVIDFSIEFFGELSWGKLFWLRNLLVIELHLRTIDINIIILIQHYVYKDVLENNDIKYAQFIVLIDVVEFILIDEVDALLDDFFWKGAEGEWHKLFFVGVKVFHFKHVVLISIEEYEFSNKIHRLSKILHLFLLIDDEESTVLSCLLLRLIEVLKNILVNLNSR